MLCLADRAICTTNYEEGNEQRTAQSDGWGRPEWIASVLRDPSGRFP